MKNLVSDGKMLPITAGADVESGKGVLQGATFGVAAHKALSGETLILALEGVYELDKAGSQSWTLGAKIYWDNTAKNCTTTSTSNTLIGVAFAAAGSSDTTGKVRLNGSF